MKIFFDSLSGILLKLVLDLNFLGDCLKQAHGNHANPIACNPSENHKPNDYKNSIFFIHLLLLIKININMNFTFLSLLVSNLIIAAPVKDSKPIIAKIQRKQSTYSKKQRAVHSANRITQRHSNKKSKAQDSSSTTQLPNENDLLFGVNVSFGNGQTFLADLDTGSSDTWIRGPDCTSTDGSCDGTKLSTTDRTITDTGVSFQTGYGSGSMSGEIFNGPVTIASSTATIPFGVSTEETGFSGPGSDGLVGLVNDNL